MDLKDYTNYAICNCEGIASASASKMSLIKVSNREPEILIKRYYIK